MDILAHGLWAGAAYKAINKKVKKPFNIKMAVFWGVFPDLFAFTIGFVWLFGNLIFGGMSFSDLPQPQEAEPAPQDTLPIFHLTSTLYNISHSAIVFLIVFGILFLIFRRPIWELGGWMIHILLDIPTHSYRFFPTPVLWPLSGWKFNGFSWATPWFLIVNYAAIIIIYLLLRGKELGKTQ
jgi:hypothetical protein